MPRSDRDSAAAVGVPQHRHHLLVQLVQFDGQFEVFAGAIVLWFVLGRHLGEMRSITQGLGLGQEQLKFEIHSAGVQQNMLLRLGYGIARRLLTRRQASSHQG